MPRPKDENGRKPLREVLSKNVRTLMDSQRYSKLRSVKLIVAASRGDLSNGKVGRIVKGDHATDVDSLGQLAAVFDLQPWQLLVDNLNPEAMPMLASSALLDEIRALVKKEEPPTLTDAPQEMVSQPKDAPLTTTTPRPALTPAQAAKGKARLSKKMLPAEPTPPRVSKPKGTRHG